MPSVRWNLVVSPDVDQSVRVFLAEQGGRKGDLSKFVEDAARNHVLRLTASKAKAPSVQVSEDAAASKPLP